LRSQLLRWIRHLRALATIVAGGLVLSSDILTKGIKRVEQSIFREKMVSRMKNEEPAGDFTDSGQNPSGEKYGHTSRGLSTSRPTGP
jgi:hypothetical protein